jgi:hypothetical protein
MDQVGPIIDRALRVDAEFDHTYASDDVAGLWKLLKKICSDVDQVTIFLYGLSSIFSAKLSLIRELREDEFPKTYLTAKEMISVWYELRENEDSRGGSNVAVGAIMSGLICFRCGKEGHKGADCSLAARDVVCSKCRSFGHLNQFCERVKKIKASVQKGRNEANVNAISIVDHDENWDYVIG